MLTSRSHILNKSHTFVHSKRKFLSPLSSKRFLPSFVDIFSPVALRTTWILSQPLSYSYLMQKWNFHMTDGRPVARATLRYSQKSLKDRRPYVHTIQVIANNRYRNVCVEKFNFAQKAFTANSLLFRTTNNRFAIRNVRCLILFRENYATISWKLWLRGKKRGIFTVNQWEIEMDRSDLSY